MIFKLSILSNYIRYLILYKLWYFIYIILFIIYIIFIIINIHRFWQLFKNNKKFILKK